MPRPTLLIASTNQGKLREYREILGELPIDLVTLTDPGITFEANESGTTFRENATLKARAYAEASGLITFAEDWASRSMPWTVNPVCTRPGGATLRITR